MYEALLIFIPIQGNGWHSAPVDVRKRYYTLFTFYGTKRWPNSHVWSLILHPKKQEEIYQPTSVTRFLVDSNWLNLICSCLQNTIWTKVVLLSISKKARINRSLPSNCQLSKAAIKICESQAVTTTLKVKTISLAWIQTHDPGKGPVQGSTQKFSAG